MAMFFSLHYLSNFTKWNGQHNICLFETKHSIPAFIAFPYFFRGKDGRGGGFNLNHLGSKDYTKNLPLKSEAFNLWFTVHKG